MNSLSILLTSDDGPDAAGLAVLASGLSHHSLTVISSPTKAPSLGTALIVDGKHTAARIVRDHLANCGQPPDLVLVGVNYGPNVGRDIIHSGTFGAALTASTWSVPAVAVSLDDVHSTGGIENGTLHWTTAVHFARAIVDASAPTPNLFLNVNVPNVAVSAVTDVVLTMPAGWPSSNGTLLPSDIDCLRRSAVSVGSLTLPSAMDGQLERLLVSHMVRLSRTDPEVVQP